MVDPTHIFGIPDNQFLCGLATLLEINGRYYISLLTGVYIYNFSKHLFVSREEAERLDPRDDRTSSIRTQLTQILIQRMYSSNAPTVPGKSTEPVQLQTQPSQQQSTGQESASSPPPTAVVPDYSQSTQISQTNSSETRNVSTVRSVSNSSPSQSQATRETTSSSLPLQTPTSTNPKSLEIHLPSPVLVSPFTNFNSQNTLPKLPSNDSPTLGQLQDREMAVSPSHQGRSPPKTLPRESSTANMNLPRTDSIASGPQSHMTTPPLHPHPKAASPPRSPPLPPMPKQVPAEIKQPGKGVRSIVFLVSHSLNSRCSVSFCVTREGHRTNFSEDKRTYGCLESQ